MKYILVPALISVTFFMAHGQDKTGNNKQFTGKDNLTDSKHIFFIEVDPLPYLLGCDGGHIG